MLGIDEPAATGLPTDLVDRQQHRLQPALPRGFG